MTREALDALLSAPRPTPVHEVLLRYACPECERRLHRGDRACPSCRAAAAGARARRLAVRRAERLAEIRARARARHGEPRGGVLQ